MEFVIEDPVFSKTVEDEPDYDYD
jgi:hypothetical protein